MSQKGVLGNRPATKKRHLSVLGQPVARSDAHARKLAQENGSFAWAARVQTGMYPGFVCMHVHVTCLSATNRTLRAWPRRFPMGSSNVGTWWPIRIKSPGLARRRKSAQSHPA